VTPRTIYVCEPQPIVLAGLRAVLADCPDLQLIGHSVGAAEAPLVIAQLKPDIVLLGHSPNPRTLLGEIPRVVEASTDSRIVLWVLDLAELECLRALQLGVKGIVRKTAPIESLIECLRTSANGQVWLEEPRFERVRQESRRVLPRMTPRERQIVELVCRGMKNKEIAAALTITPGTVKVHLMHIFEKTGVKDRFQLALHGRQLAGIGEERRPPAQEPPVVEDPLPSAHSTGW
jgi:two-component system, NarL family, nitrate/nitrite response regulator NarL